MLSNVQKEFLKLIKNCIKPELEVTIAIESIDDWTELYRLAEIHHVVPMIYDVLVRTDAYKKADISVKALWKRQAVTLMIMQTQKTEEFLLLYEKIKQCGIKPLVVKGLVCRQLYLKPDTRLSGDEDVFIKEKDLRTCDNILIGEGFIRDDDIENPNYEISYHHPKSGMRLEVHTSLFPIDSEKFKRLNREFEDAFETYETLNINGKEIYTLNYQLHVLYLLFHAYKHFIRCGFGIRQLCDLLVMSEQMREKIDWYNIYFKLKSKHLYVFFVNLLDIGERCLGFDWDKTGFPRPEEGRYDDQQPDSENLLMDILEAGVYGKSSTGREHSVNITLSAADKEGASKVSLKSSLFPSIEYMKKEYPYLRRYGWLIPIAWGQRIFAYAKKIRKTRKAGNEATNSVAIGKQRVELLRQYDLIN